MFAIRNWRLKALVLALAALLAGGIYSGCNRSSLGEGDSDSATMGQEAETAAGPDGALPAVTMPADPFSGLDTLNSTSFYPLAVSIDNASRARPQTGLSQARLVYELPVEGGITRFLAFFPEPQLAEVGPIRSVRPYFLDLAAECGAVLVHCGGSPEALARLNAGEVEHIDEIANEKLFYRRKDRSAPHNLYGRFDLLLDKVVERFAPVEPDDVRLPWVIAEEGAAEEAGGVAAEVAGAGVADHISIKYWSAYTVEYTYAPDNGRYWRTVNGTAHQSDDQPLAADHVIIQYADMDVLDDKGRLSFDASDGGRIVVFTGGTCVEGHWKRTASEGTIFSISSAESDTGAEVAAGAGVESAATESRLTLSPGIVWVLVVPQGRSVTY